MSYLKKQPKMTVSNRLLIVIVLISVYTLSYAPLIKIQSRLYGTRCFADWLLFYPVNLLYDNSSSFEYAYCLWARLWGVENSFRIGSCLRRFDELELDDN